MEKTTPAKKPASAARPKSLAPAPETRSPPASKNHTPRIAASAAASGAQSPSASAAGLVVKAWTDGACSGNPGPGGWGALAQVNGREMAFFGGANPSTNNIMELFAVIFLLEAFKGKLPAGSQLIAHTDSQYVQKGGSEWLAGWKRRGWKKPDGQPVANADFWRRFDAARTALTGVNVSLVWTRGHAGDILNERADALARRGSKASASLPKGQWLAPVRAI